MKKRAVFSRWQVLSIRRYPLLCLIAIGFAFALIFTWGLSLVNTVYCAAAIYMADNTVQPYPLATSLPYTVAIDPGHGNNDSGANGVIKEVKLCEATADALFALLQSDAAYRPILTRQHDENPKISARAQAAIAHKASLLISIHGNQDLASHSSHGFECYPTPPGRLYSAGAMRFAECVAEQMRAVGHHLRGEGSGIRFAYYSGKQKQMVELSDNKVRRQKSFGIVEMPLCPAVLVEQCFISNADDVAKWGTAEGCKLAAKMYYYAICKYFGTQAQ